MRAKPRAGDGRLLYSMVTYMDRETLDRVEIAQQELGIGGKPAAKSDIFRAAIIRFLDAHEAEHA